MLSEIQASDFMVTSTRPFSNFAPGYAIFNRVTGKSVETVVSSTRHVKQIHAKIYAELLKQALPQDRQYLEQRFERRGLQWTRCEDNLHRLPSAVPNSHRVTLMRFLMNGMVTTSRRRFWNVWQIANFAFCSARSADTIQHWLECDTLRAFIPTIMSEFAVEEAFTFEHFHLQTDLQGSALQNVFSRLL